MDRTRYNGVHTVQMVLKYLILLRQSKSNSHVNTYFMIRMSYPIFLKWISRTSQNYSGLNLKTKQFGCRHLIQTSQTITNLNIICSTSSSFSDIDKMFILRIFNIRWYYELLNLNFFFFIEDNYDGWYTTKSKKIRSYKLERIDRGSWRKLTLVAKTLEELEERPPMYCIVVVWRESCKNNAKTRQRTPK